MRTITKEVAIKSLSPDSFQTDNYHVYNFTLGIVFSIQYASIIDDKRYRFYHNVKFDHLYSVSKYCNICRCIKKCSYGCDQIYGEYMCEECLNVAQSMDNYIVLSNGYKLTPNYYLYDESTKLLSLTICNIIQYNYPVHTYTKNRGSPFCCKYCEKRHNLGGEYCLRCIAFAPLMRAAYVSKYFWLIRAFPYDVIRAIMELDRCIEYYIKLL
jgi:hypothetical protein